MKKVLNSLFISLSMYSILPAPKRAWDNINMKYVMIFMPLPGLFAGFLLMLFTTLSLKLELSPILFSAIATLIPIIITGGLHMDGYIDTSDALSSYGDMEKKLKILKDPNTGAFGVIYAISYFVIMMGLWSQFFKNPVFIFIMPIIFCLNKVISALFVVSLSPARSSGLAHLFHQNADRLFSSNVLVLEALLLLLLLLKLNFSLFLSYFMLFSVLSFLFCRFTKKLFGGITGDLIGFFIMVSELFSLLLLVCFSF